jgi:23S rRNA (adenine2503-C2)-methyltransferase
MTQQKPHIFSIPQKELSGVLQGMPSFRSKQVAQWVYEKGVVDTEAMTNISKADRELLKNTLDFSLPEISTEQKASDGVIKWLFKLHDGHEVETVFIPEGKRGTLCVSSQVGCTLNCRFCHTGTQGLSRNLTAAEIVSQVYLAKSQMDDWSQDERRKISNIVFMGMGEPLFNYENVSSAIKTIMNGLGYGGRKITLSTSGMVENIVNVGEDLGVNLAISLHAPDDETRTRIMPINKKWPIAELMNAIKNFKLKEHRRITWEYVMLDGINDTPTHAKNLIKLIEGIPSLVNIIPFNEWPGSPFTCSSQEAIDAFATIVKKAGVSVTVRQARGEDILAACGQLRSETSKFNTVSLQFPSVVARYGTEKQKTKVQIV